MRYGKKFHEPKASEMSHNISCKMNVMSDFLGERSEPHTGVFNRDFA